MIPQSWLPRVLGYMKVRTSIILGFVVLTTIILVMLGINRPVSNGSRLAKLIVDAPIHDFGKVKKAEADSLNCEFRLRNTGAQPIRIIKIDSTCGCTLATAASQTIASGASVPVFIQVAWAHASGAKEESIHITTEPKLDEPLVLRVRGTIMSTVVLVPTVISFGKLEPGEKASSIIEVVPGLDPKPFKIRSIDSSSKHIHVNRIVAAQQPSASIEGPPGKFLVTIEAPREGGYEAAQLSFHTDLEETPVIIANVTAEYVSAISSNRKTVLLNVASRIAKPETVQFTFRPYQSGTKPEFTIAQENTSVAKFSIDKVEFSERDGSLIASVIVLVDKVDSKMISPLIKGNLVAHYADQSTIIPLIALEETMQSDY
jgi:hypothetical protein